MSPRMVPAPLNAPSLRPRRIGSTPGERLAAQGNHQPLTGALDLAECGDALGLELGDLDGSSRLGGVHYVNRLGQVAAQPLPPGLDEVSARLRVPTSRRPRRALVVNCWARYDL